jgi:hypothetical protein
MPGGCPNDGNPIAGELMVGLSDVAVDEDGYCTVVELLCADCMEDEAG